MGGGPDSRSVGREYGLYTGVLKFKKNYAPKG